MTKTCALAVGMLLSLGGSVALAEEGHESHGATTEAPTTQMDQGGMRQMGMQMGKSGMAHGDDMQARMQSLHDHSKMMEGMTDQTALSDEMKKHMRMMDEMMEKMMNAMMDKPMTEKPMKEKPMGGHM